MTALDHLWPDEDRRDDALYRVAGAIGRSRPERTALSPAERRVLQAASFGLDVAGLASVLGLAEVTVTTQLRAARRALRAKNTTHGVAEAIRQGLIL